MLMPIYNPPWIYVIESYGKNYSVLKIVNDSIRISKLKYQKSTAFIFYSVHAIPEKNI
jgi:protoheme ferro-lyase